MTDLKKISNKKIFFLSLRFILRLKYFYEVLLYTLNKLSKHLFKVNNC